ncbi:hypothetical protein [Phormidium sp. CCY1219]|uniref:hypothetical protein n=1 Tax=Phormidium sp. CCY1219 TaxID=2886104 RepID=UPI002D1EC001|nr:hypothetical protein [Phormidium sp. CCY1219]MEB3830605.1 hypothetical protein [Phormidium sp. CCY1219]
MKLQFRRARSHRRSLGGITSAFLHILSGHWEKFNPASGVYLPDFPHPSTPEESNPLVAADGLSYLLSHHSLFVKITFDVFLSFQELVQ